MPEVIDQLRGGLIVSCQALPDSPLFGPEIMARMAQAAVAGGAVAIRARGIQDVQAIKAAVDVPVIGLTKNGYTGVYITPTIEDALGLQEAGADIIAVDATLRLRPNNLTTKEFLENLLACLHVPIMADVDTVEAGLHASDCGVHLVASTLSGYTDDEEATGPDISIIQDLALKSHVPVIAEGRYQTAEDLHRAFTAGAWSVVIGGAITDPITITKRFVDALKQQKSSDEIIY